MDDQPEGAGRGVCADKPIITMDNADIDFHHVPITDQKPQIAD